MFWIAQNKKEIIAKKLFNFTRKETTREVCSIEIISGNFLLNISLSDVMIQHINKFVGFHVFSDKNTKKHTIRLNQWFISQTNICQNQ